MKSEIQTKRLHLIPFNSEDEKLFLELNTDPFIRKFMWDDELIDLSTVREILIQNERHFEENKYGIWKIAHAENREIMGYTGLWYFSEEPQPQLIYALLENYCKKGYAREAAASIINYAFEKLGFDYLIAATDEPHIDSQKVAQNLEMAIVEKRIEKGKPTLF